MSLDSYYIQVDDEQPQTCQKCSQTRYAVLGACALVSLGVVVHATQWTDSNDKSRDELWLNEVHGDTRPVCKYDVWCRIYEEEDHADKYSHNCYWICENGTKKIVPGTRIPLDKYHFCTNMDPVHRKRYVHRTFEEEKVDETEDDLDRMVLSSPDEVADDKETITVNEEEATEAKIAAQEAMSEGDFEKAVSLYKKAIVGNPSALVFANRANCFIKMKRPNAAVFDCKKAQEINPESAKAAKVHAKALAMLGQWQEAFKQLCIGNKIDADEEGMDLQIKIEKKLQKIKRNEEIRAKQARAANETESTEPFLTDKEHKYAQAAAMSMAQEKKAAGGGDGPTRIKL